MHIRIEPNPCPPFATSDAIPDAMLGAILDHWPEAGHFHENSPGSRYYVLKLEDDRPSPLPVGIDRFWRDFVWDICAPLVARQVAAYCPWIARLFGANLPAIDIVSVMLTEFPTDDTYLGMHCHPHPNWLFTNVLHVASDDPANDDGRGTVICGFEGCVDPAAFDDEKLVWLSTGGRAGNAGTMAPMRAYPFRPGQLISFPESRIAYHASQRPERPNGNPPVPDTRLGVGRGAALARPAARNRRPDGLGRRLALCMHVAVPDDLAVGRYGVPIEEYIRIYHRSGPSPDPRAIDWLRRDLADLFSPEALGAADCGVGPEIRYAWPRAT